MQQQGEQQPGEQQPVDRQQPVEQQPGDMQQPGEQQPVDMQQPGEQQRVDMQQQGGQQQEGHMRDPHDQSRKSGGEVAGEEPKGGQATSSPPPCTPRRIRGTCQIVSDNSEAVEIEHTLGRTPKCTGSGPCVGYIHACVGLLSKHRLRHLPSRSESLPYSS